MALVMLEEQQGGPRHKSTPTQIDRRGHLCKNTHKQMQRDRQTHSKPLSILQVILIPSQLQAPAKRKRKILHPSITHAHVSVHTHGYCDVCVFLIVSVLCVCASLLPTETSALHVPPHTRRMPSRAIRLQQPPSPFPGDNEKSRSQLK